jgi:hypothetical protein
VNQNRLHDIREKKWAMSRSLFAARSMMIDDHISDDEISHHSWRWR